MSSLAAAQKRKSNKAGRLAEILQEQVKSTMAVFRVGGINAVLDIISAVIAAVVVLISPSNTVVFIITTQLMAIPVQYLQSANHCLLYNIDIREKVIDCIMMRNKCSKVIVLNRQ